MEITDQGMTSSVTTHSARPVDATEPLGWWTVTWLPERQLTRNAAITAMTLAELVAQDANHQMWVTFADELGVAVGEAIERISKTRA